MYKSWDAGAQWSLGFLLHTLCGKTSKLHTSIAEVQCRSLIAISSDVIDGRHVWHNSWWFGPSHLNENWGTYFRYYEWNESRCNLFGNQTLCQVCCQRHQVEAWEKLALSALIWLHWHARSDGSLGIECRTSQTRFCAARRQPSLWSFLSTWLLLHYHHHSSESMGQNFLVWAELHWGLCLNFLPHPRFGEAFLPRDTLSFAPWKVSCFFRWNADPQKSHGSAVHWHAVDRICYCTTQLEGHHLQTSPIWLRQRKTCFAYGRPGQEPKQQNVLQICQLKYKLHFGHCGLNAMRLTLMVWTMCLLHLRLQARYRPCLDNHSTHHALYNTLLHVLLDCSAVLNPILRLICYNHCLSMTVHSSLIQTLDFYPHQQGPFSLLRHIRHQELWIRPELLCWRPDLQCMNIGQTYWRLRSGLFVQMLDMSRRLPSHRGRLLRPIQSMPRGCDVGTVDHLKQWGNRVHWDFENCQILICAATFEIWSFWSDIGT